jgi:hypothetical protein
MENNDLVLKAKWASKISKLQESIGTLEPDGKNDYSGWKFISINSVKFHLSDKLPEFGLICIPQVLSESEQVIGKTIRTVVDMSFEIMDTETGFSRVFNYRGADSDSAGKSHAQAQSDTVKRFWFNLLSISERNEDPDRKNCTVTGGELKKEAKKNEETLLKDRVLKLVEAFKSKNIDVSYLESLQSKKLSEFDMSDINALGQYYKSVK